jgi:Flp pilus assembly protein TadB
MVQDVTEVEQPKSERTLRSKVASTVLVFTVPILLLAIIGVLGGSLLIGIPELALIGVVWIVGLVWVWWPRRTEQRASLTG